MLCRLEVKGWFRRMYRDRIPTLTSVHYSADTIQPKRSGFAPRAALSRTLSIAYSPGSGDQLPLGLLAGHHGASIAPVLILNTATTGSTTWFCRAFRCIPRTLAGEISERANESSVRSR